MDNKTGLHSCETDIRLVDLDDKNEFWCPVHDGLLVNAVQAQCGHRMCENCVEVFLAGETSKPCPAPQAPTEDDESAPNAHVIDGSSMVPDHRCRREMKHIKVYCRYNTNGCKDTLKLKDLDAHTQECDHRPDACKNKVNGCPEQVVMCDRDKHETVCEYVITACDKCNETYVKIKIGHVCSEDDVSCEYGCDVTEKRRAIKNHYKTCVNMLRPCYFKDVGCEEKGTLAELEIHEKQCADHLRTVAKYIIDKIGELSNEKPYLLKQEKRIAQLEAKVAKQKDVIYALRDSVQGVRNSPPVTPDLQSDLVKTALATQAEHAARMYMIENTNYDGKLLWKIEGLKHKIKDARDKVQTSFYSRPFFTHQYGYKLCARIYPNGDGQGEGTHVSLYVCIMRGQYDDTLPWPFSLNIAFKLLNGPTLVRESFLPDPLSTSYRKPITDLNVASGCPLFLDQSVLSDIADDTLYLLITVGPHIPPALE